MSELIAIDLSSFYHKTAKLDQLPQYKAKALALAKPGEAVVLTGRAPVWLYLAVAHELHGTAQQLYYDSPVTGEVLIFDHNPF